MAVTSRAGRLVTLAAIACALAPGPARADELVIEVYAGKRPAEAPRVMADVRKVLADEYGIHWTGALVRDQLRDLPAPGVVDPGVTAAQLFDQLELGKRASLRVLPNGQFDFKGGEAALGAALDAARANAGRVVAHPNARLALTRASVALAITRIRLGDQAGADEVLADLARTLGGAPLTDQGTEIEKHYNRVTAGLAKLARGTLSVHVSDPEAQIYVDEVAAGGSGSFRADLIPGPYRIVVVARGTSLRYDVTVEADAPAKLDLDWPIETALHVSDDWVGLELPAAADPSRMRELARRLRDRSRSGRGDHTILIGIASSCGRTIVTGTSYPDLAGADRLSPRARVAIGDGRDRERLRALVKFLVENTAPAAGADDALVIGDAAEPWCAREVPARVDAPPPREARGAGVSIPLAAGGAAALAGGLTWYALAHVTADHPVSLREPQVQALTLATAGSYALGAGVAGWARRRYDLGITATALLGVGVGSVVTGALLFATDEDDTGDTRSYRDSGAHGLLLGGVGVGCLGAAYLIMRLTPRSPARVTVEPSGLAVRGTF